jgi:BlaI family penicillinase repressor
MQKYLHEETPMGKHEHQHLSRRERQVMEVVYKREKVDAKDVWEEIPDFPSYSAIRSVLSILENKGLLSHESVGKKYVYSPVVSRSRAMQSAVNRLMTTYFDGSLEKAVMAMLKIYDKGVTERELKTLAEAISRARKGGKAGT